MREFPLLIGSRIISLSMFWEFCTTWDRQTAYQGSRLPGSLRPGPGSHAQNPLADPQGITGKAYYHCLGQRLIEVKERLGHGVFLPWLKSEFEWSDRTARQFMLVGERFKLAKFANLDFAPSALYLLASSTDEARDEALSLAESGQGNMILSSSLVG